MFFPVKRNIFSTAIRIHTADLKFTRICLVNSLYFSFTRDKKLFAYNLSADHQGVFSSEPFPHLHPSTSPQATTSTRPLRPRLLHSAGAFTPPQPYNNFQVKAFLHGLPLCSYPTITYHGLPHCIAPQCITELHTE